MDRNAEFVLNLLCVHLCYLWWVALHSVQVALQGQTAVIVQSGYNTGKMSLHQPLPLTCYLLLQSL